MLMYNDAVDYFEIFPWNKNFETGISLIDEQHKQLVHLLNKLAAHLGHCSQPVELNKVFDELAAYADVHFKTEEDIWQHHFKEDSCFAEHQRTHNSFLSKVLELKEEENSKPLDEVIEDILKFLTHWMVSHILDSDMRMAKMLHAIESGLSLKKAKKHADREMSRSTKVLIEIVLSMHENLFSRTMDLIREKNERKQAEKAVRKLSQAIDQAGESIMITDRKGVIEYTNPAFERITGYSAEEAIGRTPRMLKSGNQDATFYKGMWDTIISGQVWHGKVVNRKKDGSSYPTMLTISPIIDYSGDEATYSHFVGIQSDLTELEGLEHQFHQAQKMDAIGTLVGGIAHDFNNMLAGMTGNLYLAKRRTREMPDVVQKLGNIEELAFRASDMIQQLLTYARKGVISMKPVPLNLFIKETLKLLHSAVPENIKVHQDICNDMLQISGDGAQLHQVLMNLVNNARDALEGVDDPNITIGLESFHADDTFIATHQYFKAGNYVHLSVEDNGCGIPKHQIQHLFEPFFTTKEEGKGTGLGLAMVFGAIKTHQGFIEVESVKGEGTTFHIYLPLLESEDIATASSQKQVVAEGKGEKILLVDDQQQVVDTGKEVLESLGYQVLTTTDGQKAVELFEARAEEIDLVILDVVMPVMGGHKAAQCIRRINPDAKIILSTGYDKEIQTDMEHETVLNKPFFIEEMSHLIRQQLNV